MLLLKIIKDSILNVKADVLVNSANAWLDVIAGSGVSPAIHEAAGPSVAAECKKAISETGRMMPGDVAVTGAGNLSCLRIIHAVSPNWMFYPQDLSEKCLRSCYQNSLREAENLGVARSIAFPALGTGLAGVPKPIAANIVKSTLDTWINRHPHTLIECINLVCFDDETFTLYTKLFTETPATYYRLEIVGGNNETTKAVQPEG